MVQPFNTRRDEMTYVGVFLLGFLAGMVVSICLGILMLFGKGVEDAKFDEDVFTVNPADPGPKE
jgi:hypothetical protein